MRAAGMALAALLLAAGALVAWLVGVWLVAGWWSPYAAAVVALPALAVACCGMEAAAAALGRRWGVYRPW